MTQLLKDRFTALDPANQSKFLIHAGVIKDYDEEKLRDYALNALMLMIERDIDLKRLLVLNSALSDKIEELQAS